MSSVRAWISIMLVFILGAISGAAAYHAVRTRMEARLFESKDVVIEILLFRMTRDLELSRTQREEVRAALLEARRDLVVLQKDVLPIVEQVFDRTAGRIGKVLTPQQREKFEAVVKKRRQMMEETVRGVQPVPEPARP